MRTKEISTKCGVVAKTIYFCVKNLFPEQREKKQIPHTMLGIVFLKLVRLVTAGYLIFVAGRESPLTTIPHKSSRDCVNLTTNIYFDGYSHEQLWI